MTDREKVINKVTAIVADMQEEVDEWKDYSDSELRNGLTCDCDWWYKTLQMLKDALALLKAQEPRVMTPDEVKNAPEKSVVWLELKPDEIFKNEIYPFVGSGTGWYSCYCSANTTPMFTDDDVEKYGVEFRCWTSRPTDEQREAEPWQTPSINASAQNG